MDAVTALPTPCGLHHSQASAATPGHWGIHRQVGNAWERMASSGRHQGQLAVVDKHAASSCLTETPSPRGALGGGGSVAHSGQLLANIS